MHDQTTPPDIKTVARQRSTVQTSPSSSVPTPSARSRRFFQVLLILAIVIPGVLGCGAGGSSSSPTSPPSSLKGSASSTALTNVGSTAATRNGCTSDTFSPNYSLEIDSITNKPNQLYHWAAFPVHIYFIPSDLMTSTRKTQALSGFQWWADATNNGVQMLIVEDPKKAEIQVQCAERGETNYGAITDYHIDGNRSLISATITFNMTYLATIDTIQSVAAHEFGHALGIGGHSNTPGDIMSSTSSVYQDTGLTARDLNTLKTAYCGLPDALDRSSKQVSTGTVTTISVACPPGKIIEHSNPHR